MFATREHALRASSPTIACLVLALAPWVAAGVWNAWEYRSELTDLAIRHLNRLTKEPTCL